MEKVETTILKNLIFSDEYSRKVLPFIEKEYFESYHEKVIFDEIAKFIIEYNNLPTKEVLIIEAEKKNGRTIKTKVKNSNSKRDKLDAIDKQWDAILSAPI